MVKFSFLALAAVALCNAAADPHLTEAERSKALELLDNSQKEFLGSLEGVSDAQWNFKPAPERWSIAQTAEHIMLAESLIFSGVARTMNAPPDPDWEAKTGDKAAKLETMLVDRSQKVQAPEPLKPQSKLTREEIISRYKVDRAKTIKFAQTTDLPLKEHLASQPPLGELNAYDYLLLVPLHNMRHDLQIAEVKASPGYPK